MRQRTVWVLSAVAVALVALYAVLGFLVTPRIARQMLVEHCRVAWQRPCTVASIHVDPFRLTAEIRGLEIPDVDGSRMLGLARAYADFEAVSLWRRAFVFAAVRLEAPYVRAIQRSDGSLNLRALAPKPGAPQSDESPLRLAIGEFSLARGRIDLRDERRREPFEMALVPLEFQLHDFSTFAEGDHFRLIAGSDRAGRIDWQGSLETAPLTSRGTLKLERLPAATVAELLGDALPLALIEGRIDIGLHYDFALDGAPFRLVFSDGTASVTDLRLAGRGQATSWHLGAAELTGGRLDVAKRQAAAARIVLRDADAPLWIGRDGIVLPGVHPAEPPLSAAVDEAPPARTAASADAAGQVSDVNAAPDAAANPGWTLQVPELRIEDLRAHVEDRREVEPLPFELRVPAFTARNLAWPLAAPVEIEGRIESAAGGALTARGQTTFAPLTADFDVGIEALDLRPLRRYIERGRALDFRGATLSTQGRLRYAGEQGVRYDGQATIRDLHTLDRSQRQDFVRLSALEVRGLAFEPAGSGLTVREIVARRPFLRFVIGQDGITNVQDVLDPQGAALTRRAAREKHEAEARRRAKRGRGSRQQAPPPVAPPAEPPLPFPARIERVRIEQGSLHFADHTTLRPHFAAGIEDLRGSIDGLSSDPAARAEVALEGKVDRYAPVTIDGEVNYLSAQSYTDLAANFHNIELTTFTPYSGKFAGYRIDKGKLTAELNYRVENRRLNARHRIVADQLELGEKVDSPDATKLPVKLVIALLKDRHGVIDLSVPVTGTLDDPTFRLGPVIWKIVLNLLTRIVTSPFALLGSLFGDGPDLSVVDFAPGQSSLDEASKSKLDTLKKGLIERPGLSLEIPAVALESEDGPALAKARHAALLAQAAQALAPKGGTAPAVDELRAEPKRWRALLLRAYTDLKGREPEIPEPPPPGSGDDAARIDPTDFGNTWLEQELRTAAIPDADALRALGQARAEAVREVLLADGQVDAARVFLVVGEAARADDGRARMMLKLQ